MRMGEEGKAYKGAGLAHGKEELEMAKAIL